MCITIIQDVIFNGTNRTFDSYEFKDSTLIMINISSHKSKIDLSSIDVHISDSLFDESILLVNGGNNTNELNIINCTFRGTQIIISSVASAHISFNHFEDYFGDDKEGYMLLVQQTNFFAIYNTLFGNVDGSVNVRDHKSYLNMRLEDVIRAEIKNTTLAHIVPNQNSVLLVIGSRLHIENCDVFGNIATYGIIRAHQNTNITSINSTFTSNAVSHQGGVFRVGAGSFLSNKDCVFLNNTAKRSGGLGLGGVIYASGSDVLIRNERCLCQYSRANYGSCFFISSNAMMINIKVSICT